MPENQNQPFQPNSPSKEAANQAKDGREKKTSNSQSGQELCPESYKTGIPLKTIVLVLIMIFLFAATAFFVAGKMKQELHQNLKNRLENPSLRGEQIKHARKLAMEADLALNSGQNLLAVKQAEQALQTLAQPYTQSVCNKEFALADLAVLKSLAPVFKKLKSPENLPIVSINSTIRIIDEPCLNESQRADLNLYMADINACLGNFYDSMNNIYDAARCLSSSRRYSQCEELIASRELLPVANEQQQHVRDTYLGLAKVRLFFARGEREKAHILADSLRTQVPACTNDNYRKYQMFFELADFETKSGDLADAVSCFEEAKKASEPICSSHPEALSESLYHLAIRYRQMNEIGKARAQLKELESYLAKQQDKGLKNRINSYLKSEYEALGKIRS